LSRLQVTRRKPELCRIEDEWRERLTVRRGERDVRCLE
jgi:hypothetical protein